MVQVNYNEKDHSFSASLTEQGIQPANKLEHYFAVNSERFLRHLRTCLARCKELLEQKAKHVASQLTRNDQSKSKILRAMWIFEKNFFFIFLDTLPLASCVLSNEMLSSNVVRICSIAFYIICLRSMQILYFSREAIFRDIFYTFYFAIYVSTL